MYKDYLKYLQIRIQFSKVTSSESFKMFKFSKRLQIYATFKKNFFFRNFFYNPKVF